MIIVVWWNMGWGTYRNANSDETKAFVPSRRDPARRTIVIIYLKFLFWLSDFFCAFSSMAPSRWRNLTQRCLRSGRVHRRDGRASFLTFEKWQKCASVSATATVAAAAAAASFDLEEFAAAAAAGFFRVCKTEDRERRSFERKKADFL